MKKYEDSKLLLHDILTVVFDLRDEDCNSFRIVQDFEYGEEPLSFGDILQKCKDKGYIGGIILVIAENPLSGDIYQYGNYNDDYWYQVGDMKGYA